MAWLSKTNWLAPDRPVLATVLNNLGLDGRTWGGNVDAGGYSLLNLGGVQVNAGAKIGIGATAQYPLDLRGTAPVVFRLGCEVGADSGLYIHGWAANGFSIGGNVVFNGANWIAKAANYAMIGFTQEYIDLIAGTGATPGASVVPPISTLRIVGPILGINNNYPSAQVHIGTASDAAAPQTVTSWDNRHVVIGQGGSGSSTKGGVGISFDQTSNVGYVHSCQPGSAWGRLVLQGFGGYLVQGIPTAAITDAYLANRQMSIWYDSGNNRLAVRVRGADGVLKTGYIAVS
ncbi:MAG: hypothetical protein LAQ30_04345 [Acidobacteriia bacterium]|nr:hypothetical protein [Terriglobia bacterium]